MKNVGVPDTPLRSAESTSAAIVLVDLAAMPDCPGLMPGGRPKGGPLRPVSSGDSLSTLPGAPADYARGDDGPGRMLGRRRSAGYGLVGCGGWRVGGRPPAGGEQSGCASASRGRCSSAGRGGRVPQAGSEQASMSSGSLCWPGEPGLRPGARGGPRVLPGLGAGGFPGFLSSCRRTVAFAQDDLSTVFGGKPVRPEVLRRVRHRAGARLLLVRDGEPSRASGGRGPSAMPPTLGRRVRKITVRAHGASGLIRGSVPDLADLS